MGKDNIITAAIIPLNRYNADPVVGDHIYWLASREWLWELSALSASR